MSSVLAPASAGRIPATITAAGEKAIAAYDTFLNDPVRSPKTRKNYRNQIAHFSRWAEDRGLTLATVTAADASAYATSLAAGKSPQATAVALSPLRSLFHHLAQSGAIADNFFGSPRRTGRPRAAAPQAVAPATVISRLDRADLRAVRAEAMAALEERYNHEPIFQLIQSIDRCLAARPPEGSDEH